MPSRAGGAPLAAHWAAEDDAGACIGHARSHAMTPCAPCRSLSALAAAAAVLAATACTSVPPTPMPATPAPPSDAERYPPPRLREPPPAPIESPPPRSPAAQAPAVTSSAPALGARLPPAPAPSAGPPPTAAAAAARAPARSGSPPPPATAAKGVTTGAPAPGRWSVQVGVFAVAQNAETTRKRVEQRLAGSSLEAADVRTARRDGRVHVVVGDLPDRASAQRLAARMRELLRQDVALFQW